MGNNILKKYWVPLFNSFHFWTVLWSPNHPISGGCLYSYTAFQQKEAYIVPFPQSKKGTEEEHTPYLGIDTILGWKGTASLPSLNTREQMWSWPLCQPWTGPQMSPIHAAQSDLLSGSKNWKWHFRPSVGWRTKSHIFRTSRGLRRLSGESERHRPAFSVLWRPQNVPSNAQIYKRAEKEGDHGTPTGWGPRAFASAFPPSTPVKSTLKAPLEEVANLPGLYMLVCCDKGIDCKRSLVLSKYMPWLQQVACIGMPWSTGTSKQDAHLMPGDTRFPFVLLMKPRSGNSVDSANAIATYSLLFCGNSALIHHPLSTLPDSASVSIGSHTKIMWNNLSLWEMEQIIPYMESITPQGWSPSCTVFVLDISCSYTMFPSCLSFTWFTGAEQFGRSTRGSIMFYSPLRRNLRFKEIT